ncbi:MAG: inositol monophosphatase family protein, partial [Paracoccaceae bacterium]
MDHVLQSNLFALAHELAETARKAILPLFRTNSLETINKDSHGFDPVTRADKAAEKAIREILAQKRPEDGILGEEYANIDSKSGLTWVLDPIDGTRGFISGTPTWGVLIALADADGPFLG